jgi:hypothetical protein
MAYTYGKDDVSLKQYHVAIQRTRYTNYGTSQAINLTGDLVVDPIADLPSDATPALTAITTRTGLAAIIKVDSATAGNGGGALDPDGVTYAADIQNFLKIGEIEGYPPLVIEPGQEVQLVKNMRLLSENGTLTVRDRQFNKANYEYIRANFHNEQCNVVFFDYDADATTPLNVPYILNFTLYATMKIENGQPVFEYVFKSERPNMDSYVKIASLTF